jgi:hypothetical protein
VPPLGRSSTAPRNGHSKSKPTIAFCKEHPCAQQPGSLVHDRQPQARARAGTLPSKEALERTRAFLGGHTRAVFLHFDAELSIQPPERQFDLRAWRTVVEGVAQQVVEDRVQGRHSTVA